jgi:hypothetical protein
MKGFKIFLVIMLVMGIIFLLGLTLSFTHTDDQSTGTPTWLTQFGSKFVGPQALQVTDLTATPAACLQQKVLLVLPGQDCLFAIQQSTFTRRVATVQLVQGSSATVTMTQEQIVPVTEQLEGSGAITTTDLTIYPGKAHGILAIQCGQANGTGCLLKLK